jgi:hypothetical protein
MYPQRPQDSFFLLAIIDELSNLLKRRQQAWRHVGVERSMTRSSVRYQLAFRGAHFLLRCSQRLMRYSEGPPGSNVS